MKRITMVVLALLLLASAAVFAQTANHTVTITISALAVIDRDVANVNLGLTPPVNPGDPVTGSTGNARLWYTVVNAGATGTISAQLSAGTLANVPTGTNLWIRATSAEYGNALAAGTGPAGAYELDSLAAHTIVNSITSGATGRTAGDGAPILFTFEVADPTVLDTSQSGTMTVTYTIAAS
jgi:hypothetical protein